MFYRKFFIFILLGFSSAASACFVNSQSCDNNQVLNLDLTTNQPDASFKLSCDSFNRYNVHIVPKDNTLVKIDPQELRNVGSETHAINITAMKSGSTDIEITYSTIEFNGSCTVSVNTSLDRAQVPVDVSGDLYFLQLQGLGLADTQVPDKGVLYAADGSSYGIDLSYSLCNDLDAMKITYSDPYNSPSVFSMGNVDENGKKHFYLFGGLIRVQMNSASCRDVVFNTPVASYEVSDGNLRSSTSRSSHTYDTDFQISYQQDGLNGKAELSVNKGSVNLTDRDNNVQVVSSSATTENVVPRASWVLPVNGDKLTGNANNLFIWTQYPDSRDYLFEYIFPSPSFSQNNAAAAEFTSQTIALESPLLTHYDGLVLLQVFMPEFDDSLKSTQAETRLFALDNNKQIISGSLSSDKNTIGFQ